MSCKPDQTDHSLLAVDYRRYSATLQTLWFGIGPRFWINLQSQFALSAAHRKIGAAFRRLPTASGRTSGEASVDHSRTALATNDARFTSRQAQEFHIWQKITS